VHSIVVYDPAKDKLFFKHIVVTLKQHDHMTVNMHGRLSNLKNQKLALIQEEMRIRKQVFQEFKSDNGSILRLAFLKDTDHKHFRPYRYMPEQE